MKTKLAVLIALSLFSAAAFADPAPWYSWKSMRTGKIHCAQTNPGDGWEKHDELFSNAHCGKSKEGFARTSAADAERKNKMMSLIAIFASARAGR